MILGIIIGFVGALVLVQFFPKLSNVGKRIVDWLAEAFD